MYVNIKLSHCAGWQKKTKHCKSTILQYSSKLKKKKAIIKKLDLLPSSHAIPHSPSLASSPPASLSSGDNSRLSAPQDASSSFTQCCAAPNYWDEAALTLHLGTLRFLAFAYNSPLRKTATHSSDTTALFKKEGRCNHMTVKFPQLRQPANRSIFCTCSEKTWCESITISTVTSAAQALLTQVSFWWASMNSRCVAVRYRVPVNDLLLVLNRSSNFTCSTWKRESVISHYKVI